MSRAAGAPDPVRPARLPAPAIEALADLVAAGFGIAPALAVLPRQSLKTRVARQLETELEELRAGAPVDLALERLGLEITAASIRGAQARGAQLEAALRADAAAQATTTEALRKTRMKIQLFSIVLLGLTLSTLYLSLVAVPSLLEKSTKNLPAGWDLPPAMLLFERFRNLWLAAGGAFVLFGIALCLGFFGFLGRERWHAFVQDLRLYLPFLRAHAIHASSARLLEALACEQSVGIPANETVRRARRRESVPRLAADLDLAAARLEAGDPWAVCWQGTLLDTPTLADLAALAGHGAKPTKGFRWAAARHREQAVNGLRRAVTGLAALVLVPCFLYLLVLMHVASVTAAVAQVESLRLEMEQLSQEVEQILQPPE